MLRFLLLLVVAEVVLVMVAEAEVEQVVWFIIHLML
jgi:hypothetical protein